MRKNTPLDDKYAGETRDYGFNWAPYLAAGDAIEGEPLAPETVYGSVEVGSVTVSGTAQTTRLSGGEVGPVALRLGVNTAAGELLQQVVTLNIL